MRRDTETVLDMLLAAEAVDRFPLDVDFIAFEANLEKQSAVLHQLIIMGEAAKRLSIESRQKHNHIPWSRLAGMRDRLIYAYDDVDLMLVWDAVRRELPPIVGSLKELAPRE
jgi:uncharacterized protein with HEPN domain